MKPRIFLVDDDNLTLTRYSEHLSKTGYDLKKATTLKASRKVLSSQRFDAAVIDLILPDGNGIDLISEIKEVDPTTAVIVITGRAKIPIVVEAMRRGADNFLTKPVDMDDLGHFLEKCIELSSLRRMDLTHKRLSKDFQPYFGVSSSMKRVLEIGKLAAENEVPVLIQGETGTGKGFLARWIYKQGMRRSSSFIEVNCSGLTGDILLSELFGHVKGAFTSAIEDRQGLIEVADRGTLFLDEIGDMDLKVQSQFLKVLEEKTYRRVGESKLRHSDFVLISATNRNLEEEVHNGRFREDLYYRINLLNIEIPPLRDRVEDLQGFLHRFLKSKNSSKHELHPRAMEPLMNYNWPGNVRELNNVLERAFILSEDGHLSPEHFPGISHPTAGKTTGDYNIERIIEKTIKDALSNYNGDTQKVTQALGISRATLYRKMAEHKKKK